MDKFTIKQIRVGLNMTQKEMGDFLHISEVAYRNKEKGYTPFLFTEVIKICELAKLDVSKVKEN
ncbi:MAG: helix-turn-helix transcriptional regulator [Absicoccus sp.]|uniref:helix-turn-helix transcriptional regulator n=1 Tax=Absicoccus sp. TaxID=2718527 RepID=UPI002A7638F8|nr:helix-turn-helix transcriptional regulator [Absicoccus sp.]MDY3034882.1 helix-turn-helix transcriptional regulator [Absicoccus sp.]